MDGRGVVRYLCLKYGGGIGTFLQLKTMSLKYGIFEWTHEYRNGHTNIIKKSNI